MGVKENAAALAWQSRYTIWSVSYVEYLDWFERSGKPHLFSEELWERQRGMWYSVGWAKVKQALSLPYSAFLFVALHIDLLICLSQGFEDRFVAFYDDMMKQ